MLPKPEKIRKVKTEQLDLVKSLDDGSKNRRKFIILCISLLLTIGLSLGLWGYRYLASLSTNFDTSSIVSLFSRQQPTASSINLAPIVDALVKDSSSTWSFAVFNNGLSLWQRGDIITPSTTPTPTTLATSSLPQGLKTNESIIQTPDTLQDNIVITLPDHQLQIIIQVTGSSNLNSDRNLVPQLVKVIYWAVIQN